MDLTELLLLPRAGRYQFPSDPAALLPIVWGDFVSPETRGGAEDLGGCLPTVLINRNEWIFLLSDSTISSEPIEVYYQRNAPFGDLVDSSLYTRLQGATGNIAGQGFVSAIRFGQTGPNISDGVISWRGKGSLDPANQLVRDPLDMVRRMFTVRGTWLDSDFDQASLTRSAGLTEAYGLPLHWIFDQDKTYGQWLTE